MLAAMLILVANVPARAQIDLDSDTLQSHIIGFTVGVRAPSSQLSFGTSPDGVRNQDATMASLYRPPYLDFGINCKYKYQSNWLVTFDLGMWFSDNNLKDRIGRMGDVWTRDSSIVGTGGTNSGVTCHNRALSIQAGGGKIFPVQPEKNPNSGILALATVGYMRQQTIFNLNLEHAPQLEGDYGLLYDHQRQGLMLTEGLGYWYMSNNSNIYNLYVVFEVSQIWSCSTRDYMIDYKLGLQGKDLNRYFDLMFSLKLCWMFPLTGKKAHDIYFY